MGKNTLIALISLGFVSVTALVLWIICISNTWHDCWFEKWRMMGKENMMQWNMQWQKWMIHNQHMRFPGSGAVLREQAEVE